MSGRRPPIRQVPRVPRCMRYPCIDHGRPRFRQQDRRRIIFYYGQGFERLGCAGQTPVEDAMESLASLRPPVDAFFENVTVNDKDPELRLNRLRLLNRLRSAMHAVADFSKVAG